MSKITDRVTEIVRPIVEEEGCALWDVEYVREAGTWYLRVFIDKNGGVDIQDCERISRRLDPILDETDPIPDSYIFEVASAGIERELKRPSDFEQFLGNEVEVKFYRPVDGRKSMIGILSGYANGSVTVNVNGTENTFAKEQIAQVKLHVTF